MRARADDGDERSFILGEAVEKTKTRCGNCIPVCTKTVSRRPVRGIRLGLKGYVNNNVT